MKLSLENFSYLLILLFVLIGSGWLEFVMRTRLLARWRSFLLTLVPVLVVFSLWDAYAISEGHWYFNPAKITGLIAWGGIPIDEILFFVVIPIASILTLEAVRSAKPEWWKP